jgi:hypothetical protein
VRCSLPHLDSLSTTSSSVLLVVTPDLPKESPSLITMSSMNLEDAVDKFTANSGRIVFAHAHVMSFPLAGFFSGLTNVYQGV